MCLGSINYSMNVLCMFSDISDWGMEAGMWKVWQWMANHKWHGLVPVPQLDSCSLQVRSKQLQHKLVEKQSSPCVCAVLWQQRHILQAVKFVREKQWHATWILIHVAILWCCHSPSCFLQQLQHFWCSWLWLPPWNTFKLFPYPFNIFSREMPLLCWVGVLSWPKASCSLLSLPAFNSSAAM